MLTSTSKDLGKVHYTKLVDDFGILPESNNTPLSDKWFRSSDLEREASSSKTHADLNQKRSRKSALYERSR
jgi:hypothetical protein